MPKKTKAEKETEETDEGIVWRERLLDESEWRVQLLLQLVRIADAQEKRNAMLEEDEQE